MRSRSENISPSLSGAHPGSLLPALTFCGVAQRLFPTFGRIGPFPGITAPHQPCARRRWWWHLKASFREEIQQAGRAERGPEATRSSQPSHKSAVAIGGTRHQRPESFGCLSPGPHEATPVSSKEISIPILFVAQSTFVCKPAP